MAVVTRMKGGLDLGGTKIQAVVTNGESTVLGSARRETPRKGGPEAVAFELAEALRAALDDAGVEPMGLAGIGVGAPGSIDAESGTRAPGGEHRRLGRPVPARADARRRAREARPDRQRRQRGGRCRASFRSRSWARLVPGRLLGHRRRRRHRDGRPEAHRAVARPARSATSARSPAAAGATVGSRDASRPTPAGARSRSGRASSPRSARRCCSS